MCCRRETHTPHMRLQTAVPTTRRMLLAEDQSSGFTSGCRLGLTLAFENPPTLLRASPPYCSADCLPPSRGSSTACVFPTGSSTNPTFPSEENTANNILQPWHLESKMLHKYSHYYHNLYKNDNFEHSLLGYMIYVNERERASETEDNFQSDLGRISCFTVPD